MSRYCLEDVLAIRYDAALTAVILGFVMFAIFRIVAVVCVVSMCAYSSDPSEKLPNEVEKVEWCQKVHKKTKIVPITGCGVLYGQWRLRGSIVSSEETSEHNKLMANPNPENLPPPPSESQEPGLSVNLPLPPPSEEEDLNSINSLFSNEHMKPEDK
ncbi:MAG: hypothetical protein LBP31_02640 [Holosporales bacterium]|nr:hypothetical protein [Holosporales bacterium]